MHAAVANTYELTQSVQQVEIKQDEVEVEGPAQTSRLG